jgi:hypothetical protein
MEIASSRRKLPWIDVNWEFARCVGFWRLLPRFLRRQLRSEFCVPALSWCSPPASSIRRRRGILPVVRSFIRALIGSEGTFIDVGTHTGYYALYMAPLVARVASRKTR